MTTPSDTNSMRGLMMRPHEEMSSADTDLLKAMLLTAAQAVEEAEMLEQVCAISSTNPMLAKAFLLNAVEGTDPDDAHYPMARKRIEDQLEVLIAVEKDASVLASRLVEACELFRRSPGRFLNGAVPAEGVSFLGRSHDMDGWITIGGDTVPWVFASNGVSKGTIFEVNRYVTTAQNVPYAIVVGTHVNEGIVLPPTIEFVEVQLDDADLDLGRRA